jgi:hypothetical protein
MVQELGLALGGGNGDALYTAHVQDCIDKNMAMSAGKSRDLPVGKLNWCEARTNVVADTSK